MGKRREKHRLDGLIFVGEVVCYEVVDELGEYSQVAGGPDGVVFVDESSCGGVGETVRVVVVPGHGQRGQEKEKNGRDEHDDKDDWKLSRGSGRTSSQIHALWRAILEDIALSSCPLFLYPHSFFSAHVFESHSIAQDRHRF